MIIKTITCHDVYNVGASLQAYALSKYLRQRGHEVKIIDYKPDYLSRRFSFKAVSPRFEKTIFLKAIYVTLKFPQRLIERLGKKKFDAFREEYLELTERYKSLEELKKNPPEAELYIAGSDQIWNTLFSNGKDGAFYLDFLPTKARKVSYAASFATNEIAEGWEEQVKKWLQKLDRISVREKSSLKILDELDIEGISVLDPAFLLLDRQWKELIRTEQAAEGVFVYDFDKSELIKQVSLTLREKNNAKISSFFKVDYADECLKHPGPLEFLETIFNSQIIISNSFHGTVFSLIFHKEFYVIKRNEEINVRMEDLLRLVGLEDRLISTTKDLERIRPIDWKVVDSIIEAERKKSMQFLEELTEEYEYS